MTFGKVESAEIDRGVRAGRYLGGSEYGFDSLGRWSAFLYDERMWMEGMGGIRLEGRICALGRQGAREPRAREREVRPALEGDSRVDHSPILRATLSVLPTLKKDEVDVRISANLAQAFDTE